MPRRSVLLLGQAEQVCAIHRLTAGILVPACREDSITSSITLWLRPSVEHTEQRDLLPQRPGHGTVLLRERSMVRRMCRAGRVLWREWGVESTHFRPRVRVEKSKMKRHSRPELTSYHEEKTK